jgi:alginate O-acetyltransferase complex protein AlgI
MAIGLALMIGFNFPENFNNPYISRSITEFWRRWHMTLGRFMREYLYIPLGGNRVGIARLYFNLWIVFFLSGLWHGAAWNFLAWGAFHGLFLVADRLFLLKFLEKIGKIPAMIFTFFVSLIGWVLFRAENLGYAMDYLKTMFSFSGNGQPVDIERKFVVILVIAIIFSFMGAIKGVEAWQERILGLGSGEKETRRLGDKEKRALRTANCELRTANCELRTANWSGWGLKIGFALIFFLICLAAIISSGFNPFIYFRF